MQSGARYSAFAIALGTAAMLSFSIELAQFYDASRVSALSDVYLNILGTLAGTIIAWFARAGLSRTLWPMGSAPAFARLLLLAWVLWYQDQRESAGVAAPVPAKHGELS